MNQFDDTIHDAHTDLGSIDTKSTKKPLVDDTTRFTNNGGSLFSSPSTDQSPPEPEDHFNDPNHRLDCSDFVELLDSVFKPVS